MAEPSAEAWKALPGLPPGSPQAVSPIGLMVLETWLIRLARWPATVSGYGSRTRPSTTSRRGGHGWRGWHWGPAGRQTLRQELFRPFGAEGRVVLTIDPGVSAVLDAKAEPDQTITELTFESAKGDLGVFSDLPLVTRLELIRSLRALN
jgi:hypothetical protein